MANDINPAARYGRGAVVLHWLIALLIAANYGLAWASEDLPKEDRMQLMGNHTALGITILALTVLRIVWRLMHRAPPLIETLKAWEAALARVAHAALYFVMLAVPLAGWGLYSAASKGKAVGLFGLADFPALPVGSDKPTIGMFHELHEVFATLMLVLIGLHVLAALKHQFMDRDGTLRRMAPWMR